MKNILPSIT